ncbi:Muconate cycloisomerase [Rubellimicrobium mesophilum DSM 19309]|uniref:Dipeptide epimerase n=1 Tax=Rubellimicrobium mesophilum DSM 19309 TaxID=442562 RepID=A0A017HJU0_9RHOB|nr:Muconate cycloisomerase [Rubellimicrobium mesophilum DSM 19309]
MTFSAQIESFRLAQAFTISRGSKTEARVVTATVTRDGVTGRGECVPYARYGETVEGVAEAVAALPGDVTREALQRLLPPGAARNAADCALWDWEAKRAGRRVWDLAGLPAPGPVITAFTLSLDTPEAMEAQARLHAHRPLLKIKLGTPSDMPRLEAVRRGAPRSRLIVDANEGWSPEVYADLAPHLLRLGVDLVEQPLPAGQDEALAGMPRPVPRLRRRELPRPRLARAAQGPLRRGERQARQDRRPDRGPRLARRGPADGLSGHGRLHGRHLARDGAGGARGPGGRGRGP